MAICWGHLCQHAFGRRVAFPCTKGHHKLHQNDQSDQQSQWHVFRHFRLEFGKVDVEHHNNKQEQYRHRTNVDDDQQHRDEFSAKQYKQACCTEE